MEINASGFARGLNSVAVYGVGLAFIGAKLLSWHWDTPMNLLCRTSKWLLGDREGGSALLLRT